MIDALIEIGEARGHDKMKIMAKHPELKKILLYTYDPFKKYFITSPDIDGTLDGKVLDELQIFDLLDQLADRTISGNLAMSYVTTVIKSLRRYDAMIFKRILNKDLRLGVSIKSINKVWPNLIPLTYDGSKKPDVMRLKTFKKEKCKSPCMAAIKKDGVRGLYVEGQLMSRNGKKIVGLEHIEQELEGMKYHVDGELCVPGVDFDTASGLIRNHDIVPTAVYHVFDLQNYPGSKIKRYRFLQSIIPESNHIKIIEQNTFMDYEYLMHFYKWAIDGGEEGIVVYDPDSLYEDKRSHDWMRLVPIKKADCKVIDFYEGTGKLEGSLGGVIVDFNGHEVRVGSGFKEIEGDHPIEHVRDYIWDHIKQFEGMIAELEYKEKTKKGSMRHPRFKRWRHDK